MVDVNLFAVIGGFVLLLVIGSLVLFGLGVIFKGLKNLFWVFGVLLLLVAGWFLFFG